jgi:DNA polymerase
MGADEIICDEPINRFAASASPAVAKPSLHGTLRQGGDSASEMRRQSQTHQSALPLPGDAVASAAACQSLDDIVRALEAFDACPLKKTATNLCFADGNPKAHVMLIGEAPGRDEDLQGKPFVGRSGQLLDRMLASIDLSRSSDDPGSSVFITNTIFWRPPGNRTPTEAETSMCLPFLLRTIELQKPRFIMCVGATPAQRLTGKREGILKLRGNWTSVQIGGRNIPLLPTLHPAYLLRQPAQKRLAWRDLLSLRQAIDQGAPIAAV